MSIVYPLLIKSGMEFNFFSEYKHSRLLCLVLGIFGLVVTHVYGNKPDLKTIYQWSQLEFDYESEAARQADIDNHTFIPGVPAPIDVDVYYSAENGESKIFVTLPRFQPGIPITLGTVSDKMREGNPIIAPYPSWEWFKNPEACNSDRIITVYRVQIDQCGRLWVLDSGRYNDKLICSPQILAFDVKTGQRVHKYEIPSAQIESRSILVTPVVDVRDSCDDTFVYAADCQTFSIIVHDAKSMSSWIMTDKTLYPYPSYGTFNIKGDTFDLMDGILGMALTPYNSGSDRKLFYHAMSSPTENWVETSYIRNETIFKENPYAAPQIFHTYKNKRSTQSAAEAIDRNEIMYYGSFSDVTIRCFNTKGEYGEPKSSDIIAMNPVTLQFPSGMKVIKDRKGSEELWILTSRFQKIMTGSLSTSETNFRILAGKTSDLVFGTHCAKRRT